MLTIVGMITVHVTDQDKALAFYTEKLGFETRADMPMRKATPAFVLYYPPFLMRDAKDQPPF